MTSKCGKNKKVAHEAQPSVSLMTQLRIYLFYKELKFSFNDDVIYTSVLRKIISENQTDCVHN